MAENVVQFNTARVTPLYPLREALTDSTYVDPPGLELDEQQQQALDILASARPGDMVVVNGDAGSGKSTFTRSVAGHADAAGVPAVTMAPTNRAAANHTANGTFAETLHSVVYRPLERTSEKLRKLHEQHQELSANPDTPAKALQAVAKAINALSNPEFERRVREEGVTLAIVDEGSMVALEEMNALRAAIGPDAIILVVGDIKQLSVISTEAQPRTAWFQDATPNITLRGQHRFDASSFSPVELAEHLLAKGAFDDPRFAGFVVPHADDWSRTSETICAVHRVRLHAAKQRHLDLGHEPFVLPQQFDAIAMATKRSQNICSGDALRIELLADTPLDSIHPRTELLDATVTNLDDLGRPSRHMPLWVGDIRECLTGQKSLMPKPSPLTGPACIGLAGARTIHQSQGSEWDDVMVTMDVVKMGRWPKAERRRLLYTAITRARERLSFMPL
jgi:energy-coupling factor transporter ATP-binding protein EcfA2